MSNTVALISEQELDLLENFLLSDQVAESALDLVGAHGLLCALNISPERTPEAEWIDLVFDGTPNWESDAQASEMTNLLRKLNSTISNDLYGDQEILLPCELTVDTDEEVAELQIWAEGFMEGVFLHEDSWFGDEEEEVAGLLLPVMVVSDLFEEQEIRDIRKDRALTEEMCDQIPEVLIDLYLHFHAPDK